MGEEKNLRKDVGTIKKNVEITGQKGMRSES